jgi:hypothetical protein
MFSCQLVCNPHSPPERCLSQLKYWGKSRRLAHVANIFVPIKDAIYYAAQAESTMGLSHTELLDNLD